MSKGGCHGIVKFQTSLVQKLLTHLNLPTKFLEQQWKKVDKHWLTMNSFDELHVDAFCPPFLLFQFIEDTIIQTVKWNLNYFLYIVHVWTVDCFSHAWLDWFNVVNLFSDTISNHAVVNCESRALKNHCYWPIVSDFINVLSHKSIAEMFMQNDDLIRQWMKFIELLTG